MHISIGLVGYIAPQLKYYAYSAVWIKRKTGLNADHLDYDALINFHPGRRRRAHRRNSIPCLMRRTRANQGAERAAEKWA